MKGKATWKPVGLSAHKWHGTGHGRGSAGRLQSKKLNAKQGLRRSGRQALFTRGKP